MNVLDEHRIRCPYCWEFQAVLVDQSVEVQEYVEDCQVCCQPILFRIWRAADGPRIEVLAENG